MKGLLPLWHLAQRLYYDWALREIHPLHQDVPHIVLARARIPAPPRLPLPQPLKGALSMWTDIALLLKDLAENAFAVCTAVACAAAAGAAAGLTSRPDHRNRYDLAAQDDAGDTHTSWNLHRAQIPPRPLHEPTPQCSHPRVRAGQPPLKPSYDSRTAARRV